MGSSISLRCIIFEIANLTNMFLPLPAFAQVWEQQHTLYPSDQWRIPANHETGN